MCKCRTRIDADLAKHNARIAFGFTFEPLGPPPARARMDVSPPMIVLEKQDSGRRGKLPTVLASYCPFCGKKYWSKS